MAYTTIPPNTEQAIPLPAPDGKWHWSMVCDFDPTKVRFAVGGNGKWRRIEEAQLTPGTPVVDVVQPGDALLSVSNSGPRPVGVLLHRR